MPSYGWVSYDVAYVSFNIAFLDHWLTDNLVWLKMLYTGFYHKDTRLPTQVPSRLSYHDDDQGYDDDWRYVDDVYWSRKTGLD